MLLDIIAILVCISAIGFIIFCLTYNMRVEYKAWNKGKCNCGGKWKLYNWDWNGERLYNCPICKKDIEIQWNFIDKKGVNNK